MLGQYAMPGCFRTDFSLHDVIQVLRYAMLLDFGSFPLKCSSNITTRMPYRGIWMHMGAYGCIWLLGGSIRSTATK